VVETDLAIERYLIFVAVVMVSPGGLSVAVAAVLSGFADLGETMLAAWRGWWLVAGNSLARC